MADTKISALTAATTPVAGSEVLPIVQGGTTKKVSIDDLTTGKTVPANGVQFPATQVASANANCLDDYEEGTWTPAVTSFSGTITTVGSVFGTYTKIGRQVTVWTFFTITTNGTGGTLLQVKGLPFAANLTAIPAYSGNGQKRNTAEALTIDFGNDGLGNPTIFAYTYNAGYPGGDGAQISICVTYNV